MSVQILRPFIDGRLSLLRSPVSSHTFWTADPYQMRGLQFFSHSVGCLFTFWKLMTSFDA